MTAVILPSHHIVAIGKTRDRRIMLRGRLPGIDLKFFRFARQRQFAVTEANRLDAIQRIRAVVAIRRIDIGDRAGIRIEAVIRHLPGELGNVTTVATLQRVVPGAADQNVITTAALQRIVAAGTVEDIGPTATFNHVRPVVTRTGDRIRTAEIQLFDIVTQGVALTRADHTVRTLTRQFRHHIVGTVDRIGVVAVAANERIRTVTTGYTVITAARRNNSTGLTLDRQRVIAFAKVDRLHILDTKLIIAGTKRQAVRTLAKINRTLIHRLAEGHRLIGNAAGKADRRQRQAVGIITLAEDARITAVLSAIRRPGDNKAAVIKCRDRRIILRRVGVAVGHELVANRRTRTIKHLTTDIRTGTAIMAAVITPGDDKTTVIKGRHRRLVLVTRRVVVDPEVATQDLWRQDQIAIIIGRGRREDLTADIVTGACRAVVVVLIV